MSTSDWKPQLDRDLFMALAPAIGVARARTLKVWSRYQLDVDAIEAIVEFEGQFYEFGVVQSFSPGHTDTVIGIANKIIKASRSGR